MVRTGPTPQVHILNIPWSPADDALLGVGGNFRRWGLHEGQRPRRWVLGDCGGLNKNIPIGLCTGTVGGAVGEALEHLGGSALLEEEQVHSQFTLCSLCMDKDVSTQFPSVMSPLWSPLLES